MLGHVIQKHEATHDQARPKAPHQKNERANEMAALVWGIKEDVCSTRPAVHEDDLHDGFIDAFLGNDPNLLMALEAALVDKENKFDIRGLPLLKDVITQYQSTAAGGPEPTPLRMKVDATQLEEHEFKLWKIRAEHDAEAFL